MTWKLNKDYSALFRVSARQAPAQEWHHTRGGCGWMGERGADARPAAPAAPLRAPVDPEAEYEEPERWDGLG